VTTAGRRSGSDVGGVLDHLCMEHTENPTRTADTTLAADTTRTDAARTDAARTDAARTDDAAESAGLDVSGYVRRVRRLADLSQRDLAERVGTPQAVISRIESGGDVSVRSFERLLAVAGLRLVVVDANAGTAEPMPRDVFRDLGGRRRPAHLDVHAEPERPTMQMLLHDCDPVAPGAAWHHKRSERDRLRRQAGIDSRAEQLSVSLARQQPALRRPGSSDRRSGSGERSAGRTTRAAPTSTREQAGSVQA